MTKRYLRAVLMGGLVLTLALFLGGCENPASGDSGPSAAAETFKDSHSEILEKSAARATLSDEAAIDAALEAYEALDDGVKAELAAEKEKLDKLKAGVNGLKTSTLALRAYMEGKPDNTAYTPYPVAYTGNETPAAIYNALAAAGKYVSLDLSGSSVTGFTYDVEPGRALVVDLVLPDSLTEIEPGTSQLRPFYGFNNLKTVRAAGLLSLGAHAFHDRSTLKEAIMDKVEEVGTYAFGSCGGLTALNLPAVTSIGPLVFYSCSGLTTLNLSSLTAIAATNVFSGCSGVVTIDLSSVTSIGNNAFGAFRAVTTVILGNTPPTVGTTIFNNVAQSTKTIAFKVPDAAVYEAAGSPWSDKVNMTNTAAGNYWDNNSATRGNLTVNLTAIE